MGLRFFKGAAPQNNPKEIPSWCLFTKGLNDQNQCGSDYNPFNNEQVVISVVGGIDHSLGILKTGEFVSWGSNEFGQLGSESDSYLDYYLYEKSSISLISFPKQFSKIVITSISAGAWHSACVTDTCQVFAWGLGTDGQLGISASLLSFSQSSSTDRILQKPALVESLSKYNSNAVYCGSNYTVVRTQEGRLISFGNGTDGVLGNGKLESTYKPQEIIELAGVKIKKVACGFNYCLALTTSGLVFEWGNLFKDIFNKSEPITVPRKVGLERISDIACGDYHCCALQKRTKDIYLWGSNGYGQIGSSLYGKDFFTEKPVLSHLNGVAQISCGGLFTVVKMRDNSVFAWGCNRQKQIGEHFDYVVREPVMVISPNSVLKKISCGYSHVFFLSCGRVAEEMVFDPRRDISRKGERRDNSIGHDLTCDRRV